MVDRVLLDVDGVLIQNPYKRLIFPEVARKLVEEERVQEFVDMMLKESIRRTREGKLVSAYDWDDIVRVVSKRIGVEGNVSVANVVVEVCSSSAEIKAYPDAIPTLLKLRNKGIELIALTNGFYDIVTPVLRKTGVLKLLDDLITPDKVGAAKPSPRIFLVASEGAVEPIFVGDSVSVDICGANSAGISSVLIWRELPEELSMDPKERAAKAHTLGLIQEKLMSESTSFLAPSQGCVPDFLIQNLEEIIRIVERTD